MQITAATVENSMESPQKKKKKTKKPRIRSTNDPAIPLLAIYSKEYKIINSENISTTMIVAVLFPIAKIWKQPGCPSTNEWIRYSILYIYIVGYYSALKDETFPFSATLMNLENIMLMK